MPLYEFKCKTCRKVTERFYHVAECPDRIKCSCGKTAKKILSHTAVHTDGDVKWMADANKILRLDWEKPIETRGEWKKHLKDHNLIAAG